MSNPSDWNRDDDTAAAAADDDAFDAGLEGGETLGNEAAYDDDDEFEDEEPGEDGDEDEDEHGRPEDAATMGGGCLRTMIRAVAFWMAVAVAALAFCVVFGGRW